jgi:hypothetical protein
LSLLKLKNKDLQARRGGSKQRDIRLFVETLRRSVKSQSSTSWKRWKSGTGKVGVQMVDFVLSRGGTVSNSWSPAARQQK